jgi:hypothetical protein
MLYFNQVQAVDGLERTASWESGPMPETFPSQR